MNLCLLQEFTRQMLKLKSYIFFCFGQPTSDNYISFIQYRNFTNNILLESFQKDLSNNINLQHWSSIYKEIVYFKLRLQIIFFLEKFVMQYHSSENTVWNRATYIILLLCIFRVQKWEPVKRGNLWLLRLVLLWVVHPSILSEKSVSKSCKLTRIASASACLMSGMNSWFNFCNKPIKFISSQWTNNTIALTMMLS